MEMGGSGQDRMILFCVSVQAKLCWRTMATAIVAVASGTTSTSEETHQEADEYPGLSMELEKD